MLVTLVTAGELAAQHIHTPAAGEPSDVSLDAALASQIEGVRAATARFQDHRVAEQEGFRRFGNDGPLMGEHWYRPEQVAEPLDLTRPSTLQYALVDGERVLVGVAYTLYQRPGETLPEGFAGADDHWHTHDVVALARELAKERPLLRWLVNRRISRDKVGAGEGRTQLTMVHAWVWSENPDGVFAENNRAIPYLRAGLPSALAQSASSEAANGVALLKSAGCEALSRESSMLRVARGQRRRLDAACAEAAERVRTAVEGDPAQLNEAAASAWRDLSELKGRILTAEQKERLARLAGATMHPAVN